MATFNVTDILVRNQLLGQYISNAGSDAAIAEFYGKECWEKHLKDLELLVALSRVLRNYHAQVTETLATCTLTLTGGNSGTITVKLNSQTIGSTSYSVSLNTTATNLATNINTTSATLALTARFTAIAVGSTITISAPLTTGDLYNTLLLGVITTGTLTDTLTIFSGGVTKVTTLDNCLTEDQAQHLWNEISKLTGICFQPINASYITYASTLPVNQRIINSGESRITEQGNNRVINR